MASTTTDSSVRIKRASYISLPVTGTSTAVTTRMKPCRGAVSNNDNNDNNNKKKKKKKADFCSLHLPHEVGAQGQCMHRVWGSPDVVARREAGDV